MTRIIGFKRESLFCGKDPLQIFLKELLYLMMLLRNFMCLYLKIFFLDKMEGQQSQVSFPYCSG